jgi:hypothetical protein
MPAAKGLNGSQLTYLIQNAATRQFFYRGTWTAEAEWAEEFPSPERAMTACLHYKLRGIELVLQFGFETGRKYQLQLPLPEQLLWPVAACETSTCRDKRSSAASLLSP